MFLTVMTFTIALLCLFLIGVVLIQNPKGGGINSSFSGKTNQTLGAARSSTLIERFTWVAAFALFALCILSTVIGMGS